jgi:hypothetical protein
MRNSLSIALIAILVTPTVLATETLFSIYDINYEGAIRFPVGTYGDSRMGFSQGTFELSADLSSIFIVGHAQHQAIAEFYLAPFSKAETLSNLPMAKNKQPFSNFLDRVPTETTRRIDRITGLELLNDKLIVNGTQYYDGEGSNIDTTFIIDQPDQLATSPVSGFLKLQAKSHASGWMTPIPSKLQGELEGNYIFGYASNYAINLRNSMGPSAFSVNIEDVLDATPNEQIPTQPLIDYSIHNLLAEDLYNKNGGNDLWTEVSSAFIGFIVPGSTTYAVFGISGGHNSGIGYKITQDNGFLCGGPCPFKSMDVYNYYWLYDVKDMVSVAQGKMQAYQVRPYEYGIMEFPFEKQGGVPKRIIGASYNQVENKLFFLLGDADNLQNQYESAPLLLAYSIKMGARPNSPSSLKVD